MNSQKFFAENGVFHSQVPEFQPRVAQQEMAHAVEDALKFHGKLVVESGTGTGKTYAYLVPVILSGKRTIISTATKHLQEQIFYRDLPDVLAVMNEKVNAVLLKGRSNYLCLHRLAMCFNQADLVGRQNTQSYEKITQWAVSTNTGDISEVQGVAEESLIWREVTSTAENCLGGKCPVFSKCHVNKARQRAMKADLVVVNHHLFFSDLGLKKEGFGELLPDQEAIIFDEAHNLAEIASLFFGFSVSSHKLKELCQDVQVAEREEKSAVDFDVVQTLDKNIADLIGYFTKQKVSTKHIDELESQAFDRLYDNLLETWDDFQQALSEAATAGENLQRCFVRCLDIQEQLINWRENRNSESVSWLEARKYGFKFTCTPLNIGKFLAHTLNKPKVSWVFTSATLAVNEDFSAFVNELGLEIADTRSWPSPYDYKNHALLYLPVGIPDPGQENYANALGDIIFDVTALSQGRAFCLFTSYAMMLRVYNLVSKQLKWPILLQGEKPKQQLLEAFLSQGNTVLFGTYSFWQGVDVKGNRLSCVIVDKLPFASPGDPVLKKKLQMHEENGGNAFLDVQVPQAVISLKQGVGRLIRSEQDKGLIVLCDPRIKSKAYGHIFQNSLPAMPVTSNLNQVAQFFRKIDTFRQSG